MPRPEPGSPGVSGSPDAARPAGTATPPVPGGPGPALLGSAAVGAAIAALVTGASFAAVAGPWALAGVLLAAQSSLAWAWARALGASAGTVALVAASALAGDLAVLWPGGDDDGRGGHGYDDNGIGTVAGVVGVSLAVTVLYQLARRQRPGGAGPPGGSAAAVPAHRGAVPAHPTLVPPHPAAQVVIRPLRAADRVSGDMAAALGGVTIAAFLTGFLVLRAEAGAEHPPDSMVIAGLLGAGTAVLVGRAVIALLGPAASEPAAHDTVVSDGTGVFVDRAGSGEQAPTGPAASAGRFRFRALAGAMLGAAAGTGAGAVFGDLTDLGVPAAAALAAAGAVAAACAIPVGPALPTGSPPVVPAAVPLAVSASGTSASATGLPAGSGAVGVPAGRWSGAGAGLLLGVLIPLALAAPMVYLVGRQLPG
ncbi:hypothetical protein CC117_03120 [Parafrankia colletiae]|uniref:Uncharacterized protein n=1 Tax=Parafrankia colletiae TaxID=573497 RepID=A0A1S1QZN6_9ACTN|nr:hypothetical protein [Parafrankia colletiae]MCK9899189.1 hypothetical protein [Frankia sp. Cpl3]OHV38735.1 hypothetical protein CC117_03120 [Parafrankia colletiae]